MISEDDSQFLKDLCTECDKFDSNVDKKKYIKNLDSKSKIRLIKIISFNIKDLYVMAQCDAILKDSNNDE